MLAYHHQGPMAIITGGIIMRWSEYTNQQNKLKFACLKWGIMNWYMYIIHDGIQVTAVLIN